MAANVNGLHHEQLNDWWKEFCKDFVSEHHFDFCRSASPFVVDVPVPGWLARMGAERMEFRPVVSGDSVTPAVLLYGAPDAETGKAFPMAVILPSGMDGKNTFPGGTRVLTGEVMDAVLDELMLQAESLRGRLEANLREYLGRRSGPDAVSKALESVLVQDFALDDKAESRASIYQYSRFLDPPLLAKVRGGALARLEAIRSDIDAKLTERQKRERRERAGRSGEDDVEAYLDRSLDRRAGRMDFRLANLSDHRQTLSAKEVTDVCDWALTPPAKRRPGCRYDTYEPSVVKRWAQQVCKEFGIKTEKLPARLRMQNATQKAKLVKQVK